MIAVDASAVLAVLLDEPDATAYSELLTARGGLISPVNRWEILVGAYRERGDAGVTQARALIESLGLETASVSKRDSDVAFEAFRRFGKGVGGPLNLGDCFAYALAETEGDGLVFKGDDFPRTDIKPAL